MGHWVENVTKNSYLEILWLRMSLCIKGKIIWERWKILLKGWRRCTESVIFFGTGDRITDIESEKEFLTKGTEDNMLVELKEARHFLMTKLDIFYFKEVTEEWLA